MTLEELYGKIMADDEIKAEVAKAAIDDRLVEWAAEQGVETTEKELFSFMRSAVNQRLSL